MRRADEVGAASDALCAAPLRLLVQGLGLRPPWRERRVVRVDADSDAGVRTLKSLSCGGQFAVGTGYADGYGQQSIWLHGDTCSPIL